MLKQRKDSGIIAMIPARIGSTRLAMKNLALLNNKPLIYYAIQAAKDSGVFDRVVVNSEDAVFGAIARRYGVEFYRRPARLGSSGTKSDFVVSDFIQRNPCDIVAWVNPTSPLQTGDEIRGIADFFLDKKLDTLVTVEEKQVHCLYKGKPLNFKFNDLFAKTQDLTPVQPFVYSVMMWRSDVFLKAFRKDGHAFFCGRLGFYPVGRASAMIIKREEDLMMAELMMRALARDAGYKVRYDRAARDRLKRGTR